MNEPDDAILASVNRITSLMEDIEREVAVLGRATVGGPFAFQWGAMASWRTEAELRLAEALAGVGIVTTKPGEYAPYRRAIAKAVACLDGEAAGARYLARWDQVEAQLLALIAMEGGDGQ